MQIRVGCVDGKTYSSKPISNEEIQDYLDSRRGRIGFGFMDDLEINTVEELAQLVENAVGDSEMKTLALETEAGNTVFAIRNIVWVQVDR